MRPGRVAADLPHEEYEVIFAEPVVIRLHQRGPGTCDLFFGNFFGTAGQIRTRNPPRRQRNEVSPFPVEGKFKQNTDDPVIVVFNPYAGLRLPRKCRLFYHRRPLKKQLLSSRVLQAFTEPPRSKNGSQFFEPDLFADVKQEQPNRRPAQRRIGFRIHEPTSLSRGRELREKSGLAAATWLALSSDIGTQPGYPELGLRLRAGGFLAPQRQEVLCAFDGLRDLTQQLLQIFVAFNEIDLGGINDQQVRRRVMKEKVLVSLDHLFQILFADRLFGGGILFLQALLEHFRSRLQIDDQVGRRQLFAKIVVIPVIGIEFLVIEIEAGEDFVFLEDE